MSPAKKRQFGKQSTVNRNAENGDIPRLFAWLQSNIRWGTGSSPEPVPVLCVAALIKSLYPMRGDYMKCEYPGTTPEELDKAL